MIDELPRHAELAGEFFRERLHTEGLGGIVAAVEKIDPEFLRQGEREMRAFTGDKRIKALRGHARDISPRSAGDDGYRADLLRAAGCDIHRTPHRLGKPVLEFI